MSRTRRAIQKWCKPGTSYYEEIKAGTYYSNRPKYRFERNKNIHGRDGLYTRGVREDFDPDTGAWGWDLLGGPNLKRDEKRLSRRRSRHNAKKIIAAECGDDFIQNL